MSSAALAAPSPLLRHVDPAWPPMRHVLDGMAHLPPEALDAVAARVDGVLARFTPAPEHRVALRRFFSFLSQVEVIAIEVPLRALPHANDATRPLLMRQLADEVFHATVFAALAKRLGGLDAPIPEAETLLDRIRDETDPKAGAVLLNLLAEGWIENLFDNAITWNVANVAFQEVLDDETRHVHEAMDHAQGVDASRLEPSVRALEAGLFQLVQHPRVVLPALALAGTDGYRRLGETMVEAHRNALAEVGLTPGPAVKAWEDALATQNELARDAPAAPEPVPMTHWRRTALEMWDGNRSPVMHGFVDIPVPHVPRKLLTPIVVAAIGQAWHENPRFNRFVARGSIYQAKSVNVGVRVIVDDAGEALSTVVIPDAHTRSVRDIARILQAGLARLRELGSEGGDTVRPNANALDAQGRLRDLLRDPELMELVPPEATLCTVTVSNVGRFGLVAGVGAMPGALSASCEVNVGTIRKLPRWTGWRYKPVDHVTFGCSVDHRVFDGSHAGQAMRALQETLAKTNVQRILARDDTLPGEPSAGTLDLPALHAIPTSTLTAAMAIKGPGWWNWLWKK